MNVSNQETIDLILSLRKEGKTYAQIMEITGCSKGTISKYCILFGLSENSKKIEDITPELLEKIQRRYEEVGNLKKVAKEFHTSATRLRKAGLQVKNPQKNYIKEKLTPQASCAQKTKLKAVEYKGGKCLICGYNKCVNALTFHHINPEEKSFGISGGTRSFEKLKPELDKCVLLCHNCHAEVHAGLIDLNNYLT